MNTSRMRMTIAVLALILALVAQGTSAHKHTLDPDGKDGGTIVKGNGDPVYLANGQNHAGFTKVDDGALAESCGGDSAAYGLETAHHGPDDGTPGRSDNDCYATAEYSTNPAGGVVPADDNPAFE